MKIICIGRNYVDHIAELANEVPTEPVIFTKPASSLEINPVQIVPPTIVKSLHHEVELVLQIGSFCTLGMLKKNWQEVCSGIFLGIDFTDREKQNELKSKGLPWELAKSFQSSAIISRKMVSPSNNEIFFSLNKNGAIVQKAQSGQMINDFDKILTFTNQYFSLIPGDLIFTGTPAGVGQVVKGDLLEGYLNNEKFLSFQIG